MDFLANCMCPANFGRKHPNSDKVPGKILEKQPELEHCPASRSERSNPVGSAQLRCVSTQSFGALLGLRLGTNPSMSDGGAGVTSMSHNCTRRLQTPPRPSTCQVHTHAMARFERCSLTVRRTPPFQLRGARRNVRSSCTSVSGSLFAGARCAPQATPMHALPWRWTAAWPVGVR